jgi:hypothetical protein
METLYFTSQPLQNHYSPIRKCNGTPADGRPAQITRTWTHARQLFRRSVRPGMGELQTRLKTLDVPDRIELIETQGSPGSPLWT